MRSFTEPGSPESAAADCWLGDRPPRNRSPNIAAWTELRADVELSGSDRESFVDQNGWTVAIVQRYQHVLDNTNSACKSRHNHGEPLVVAAVCRPAAASGKDETSEEDVGGNPVSCDVFIHQTQDQGIEAIGPGAGRDDYDQHKSIKRLR
jgi:hypothetical protein